LTHDLYRQAEEALRAGRLAEAAELLERVCAAAGRGSDVEELALFDLAGVRERLGDVPALQQALRDYLERHPRATLRDDVRRRLCRTYQASGPGGSLRSCLETYLEEFPDGRGAAWVRRTLKGLETPSSPASHPGDGG